MKKQTKDSIFVILSYIFIYLMCLLFYKIGWADISHFRLILVISCFYLNESLKVANGIHSILFDEWLK